MLRDALFLAGRSVRAAPVRTAVLALGLGVALFLPLFTRLGGALLGRTLLERASATPLVVGAKGSRLDLVLATLYFRSGSPEPISYGAFERIQRGRYGVAVPLDVRHSAFGVPIVGTSPEYFEQRGLRAASGRLPALLGEIVAGAAAAERLRLEPGATVRSDLRSLYNLAGAYPTVLDVVGILEATGGPDDDVLFTGVRTAWVLDGALHGHDDVAPEELLDPGAREGDNLEASAAVFLFQRITEANRDTFHLHGALADEPITAVLVFPRDQLGQDRLLGDLALDPRLQAVRPVRVVRSMLDIVVRVSAALDAYFAAVALSTAAFSALVVWLSVRLRRAERLLMRRIGASRGAVAAVLGAELALTGLLALMGTGLALLGALYWLERSVL